MLPAERLHLPFAAGPFRLAMALQAIPPAELLEIDDRYGAEMAERGRLLATRHGDVFAATPAAEAASRALLAFLAAHLPRRYPDWFAAEAGALRNALTGEAWDVQNPALHPLELCGRLVQEDFCLIGTDGAAPVLTGAVLCAPSRWRLAEKIGRPLAAVHGPVPGYAEALAGAVDRFMAALRPGRAAMRLNWSVVDDPALFQPGGHGRTAANTVLTPDNAPERLFLRVERQSFLRLPEHGTTVFAIRVHSYSLARVLEAGPAVAAEFAAAVRALPPAMQAYKSLPAISHALLPCLDRHASG